MLFATSICKTSRNAKRAKLLFGESSCLRQQRKSASSRKKNRARSSRRIISNRNSLMERMAEAGQQQTCSTMAWEQRGSHSYYYRKERSGGRVRSIYVGRGDIAELSAALDEMEQIQQETKLRKERRQRETFKSLDASLDSLSNLASTLTHAVLIAGGFHQHKRQWRKQKA